MQYKNKVKLKLNITIMDSFIARQPWGELFIFKCEPQLMGKAPHQYWEDRTTWMENRMYRVDAPDGSIKLPNDADIKLIGRTITYQDGAIEI